MISIRRAPAVLNIDSKTPSLSNVLHGVARWIESVWMDPWAPLYDKGQPHFLPTCFAVLAAECCGLLDSWPDTRRADVADQIASRQSEPDGLFDPGPLRREDLSSHSATYIRMQATYFGIHALSALGHRPRRRIEFTARLLDTAYLRGWLDGGPWQNPWLHSNTIMFALCFLHATAEATGDTASIQSFDELLRYLNERQDEHTGLWQPDDGIDQENAVYAAYHFFPYFFWRGYRPRFVEAIIDSTLGIQKADGLFAPGDGGGACEDLDAVHTLVMMSLMTNHRAEEIRIGLERCFHALLQVRQSDGGFLNYRSPDPPKSLKRRVAETTRLDKLLGVPARRRLWRHSGWGVLSCPVNESDMWSAWFRPLSLKLIAARYPERFPGAQLGRYRALPGLGWHVPAAIAESRVCEDPGSAGPRPRV